MAIDLHARHFLKLEDFEPEEIDYLLALAADLKAARSRGEETPSLQGQNIVLLFEKTSTRTRAAFEVAAFDQGARVSVLDPHGSHIGHKESIRDTARVLGRMYHAIAYRGFGQEKVEELASYAGVPVFNALTEEYHPTQFLADALTMREHHDGPLGTASFCYLGDARFNMARSLLMGAAKLGMDARIAAPRPLWPSPTHIERCEAIASRTGGRIQITESVEEGVKGVDFLYTDVWVSMGEDESIWAERVAILRPYRVDRRALELTGNDSVKFMHCLPAYHDRQTTVGRKIAEEFGLEGVEVTDDVFESSNSIVWDQAENRLHSVKAVLCASLGSTTAPAANAD